MINMNIDENLLYIVPEPIDVFEKTGHNRLALINKYFTLVEKYEPRNLIIVDSSHAKRENIKLRKSVYNAFLKMLSAANEENIDFFIAAGYRSYKEQLELYEKYLNLLGEATCNSRVAFPGRSEHHTGWAIDINSKSMKKFPHKSFAELDEGIWLRNNAHKYGFILRYPEGKSDITGYIYEPWHFRYVGKKHAKFMYKQNLTLEEYVYKK